MILLDIGNTHTRIARAEGEKITILRTLRSVELSNEDIPSDPEGVWGASVFPAVASKLESVNFINAALAGKIVDFSCVDSSTIGADRLANAVAALDHGTPALVLDCGSAITIELVDSDLRFRGGAIAPGRKMLRQALHANTAQLPEIPLSSRLPV
ncbi:MAG: type III pantothenate kinase, partial [Lentisphaeria bacterium]|nr:type III pantothenate kinase [Lentisphaeria bacterium]